MALRSEPRCCRFCHFNPSLSAVFFWWLIFPTSFQHPETLTSSAIHQVVWSGLDTWRLLSQLERRCPAKPRLHPSRTQIWRLQRTSLPLQADSSRTTQTVPARLKTHCGMFSKMWDLLRFLLFKPKIWPFWSISQGILMDLGVASFQTDTYTTDCSQWYPSCTTHSRPWPRNMTSLGVWPLTEPKKKKGEKPGSSGIQEAGHLRGSHHQCHWLFAAAGTRLPVNNLWLPFRVSAKMLDA